MGHNMAFHITNFNHNPAKQPLHDETRLVVMGPRAWFAPQNYPNMENTISNKHVIPRQKTVKNEQQKGKGTPNLTPQVASNLHNPPQLRIGVRGTHFL